MNNVEQTIISQYANAPTIRQLIDNMNQWFDQSENFAKFQNEIWNITTATTYGLDLWGRILGISRRFFVVGAGSYFGFNGNDPDYQPFNQAPFYNGSSDSDAVNLDNDAFRVVLLTKALVNILDTSVLSLNRMLRTLFAGRGKCYVDDLGDMQLSFTFEFELTGLDKAIIRKVMPHPVGVSVLITEII